MTITAKIKARLQTMTDDELKQALQAHFDSILRSHGEGPQQINWSDEAWNKTVLDYARKDWALGLGEKGFITVHGEEHRSYFGEFVYFDYCTEPTGQYYKLVVTDGKGEQHELMAAKPYSETASDWYLLIVIHATSNVNTPIAVHTMNIQTGGLSNGYYCTNMAEALSEFNKR